MSYNNYMLMHYIALGICIFLLLVTILLFFLLRIPEAFGFLTKLTEKKAIKKIQKQNEQVKRLRESEQLGEKETERISPSGRLIEDRMGATVITEKIDTEQLGGSETVLLDGNAGDKTLSKTVDNKAGLSSQNSETMLLDAQQMPYTFQSETTPLPDIGLSEEKGYARVVQEIIFIHTTEIII